MFSSLRDNLASPSPALSGRLRHPTQLIRPRINRRLPFSPPNTDPTCVFATGAGLTEDARLGEREGGGALRRRRLSVDGDALLATISPAVRRGADIERAHGA